MGAIDYQGISEVQNRSDMTRLKCPDGKTILVKDLTRLNRDFKKVIQIESDESLVTFKDNMMIIPKFTEVNRKDTTLLDLVPLIDRILELNNIKTFYPKKIQMYQKSWEILDTNFQWRYPNIIKS